jgi:hypothetical protein
VGEATPSRVVTPRGKAREVRMAKPAGFGVDEKEVEVEV